MRRAFALAAWLVAAPAWGLFEKTIQVDVRDPAGRPAEAFVWARELGELGKIHGTITVCVRADLQRVAAGTARIQFPAPTPVAMTLRDFKTEVSAYRPGHCVARAQDVESVTLRIRPAPRRPEERLAYLEQLAATLVCRRGAWSRGSAAAMDPLIAAIEAEVKPLVLGPYEQEIAARIRMQLKLAKTFPTLEESTPQALAEPRTPPPRDFLIAPGNQPSLYDERAKMWVLSAPRLSEQIVVLQAPSGNRPGSAAGVVGATAPIPGAVQGGAGAAQWDRSPPTIRCRHGAVSKCNFDQRDAQGETALGVALKYLRTDEVKLLLDAGADPSVNTTPGGLPAIDLLLQRSSNLGTWEADRAHEILAMLGLVLHHIRLNPSPVRLKSR